MAVKQVRALAVHLADHFPTGAQLIYVKDTTTNFRYLVDSLAALSIILHHSLLPSSGLAIINANVFRPGILLQNVCILAAINFLTNFCKLTFLSPFLEQIFSKQIQ